MVDFELGPKPKRRVVHPTDEKPLREAALALARDGHSVLPLGDGKKPVVKWKRLQTEPASEGRIRRWFAERPVKGIALIANEHECVLDLDAETSGKPGRIRRAVIDAIERELRQVAPLVRTPSGGLHIYLHSAVATRTHSLRGEDGHVADLKARGGYSVLPPTRGYETASDVTARLNVDDALDWSMDILARHGYPVAERAHATATSPTSQGIIPEGERNRRLCQLAGAMRAQGAAREAIFAGLLVTNWEQCDPPLPESEVKMIADWISTKPSGSAPSGALARRIEAQHRRRHGPKPPLGLRQ